VRKPLKREVGTYRLGFRNVRLFVEYDSPNGSVDFIPDDGGTAIVTVGIDSPLSEAISVLLHELYESILIDLNTRYKKMPSFSSESSDFIFIMTHNQLGEAHERIGIFLTDALPDFMKAYDKFSTYKDSL